MARAPDPKAAQAKEMFLAGKKLIEISAALDVPEGTVRSWKNRYGWANATLQKPKRNVARKRGGQPGNKNAVGHGGTGPPGNKNAVTTGEFETLLFDCLDPEERRLADAVPTGYRRRAGITAGWSSWKLVGFMPRRPRVRILPPQSNIKKKNILAIQGVGVFPASFLA